MIKSFNSWSSLTEAIAKGKDTMIDPTSGKKHKITYKVQSNTKFVMKIINDLDVIDASNKLTATGIEAIKNYFNEEDQFTMTIGQFTPSFFTKKFIVYTILKDGELFGRTKQKIQFEIIDRNDAAGAPAHPNVTAGIQFIDDESFKALSALAPAIVTDLLNTANQAQLPDPTAADPVKPAETENAETKKEQGKKFLYTMRTNSKLYKMEFIENGSITAKTQDGSDPNGTVSYDAQNKKVMWSTTLDDADSKDSKISKSVATPLFTDSEITNVQDKTFLEKMFTDDAFRKKIIDEYEKEYASTELTPENLRTMLFYKDGKSIFGTNAPAETAVNPEEKTAGLSKDQEAAFIKGIEDMSKAINPSAPVTPA